MPNRRRRTTRTLGLAALLAAVSAAGAHATQRAGIVITGTATPPVATTTSTSATTSTSTSPPRSSPRIVRRRPTWSLAGSAPTAGSARRRAHAAGDPGVTIADFHFSPGTTTVHVGDTVTWANNGPSAHSATATNGSFNTGILQPGHSASHTFTQAGTFAYVCEIHPFMHGTIVVLAGTTSSTSPATQSSPQAVAPTTTTAATATTTGAPTTTTTPRTAAAGATGQPALPVTGLDVLWGLAAGLVLIACGAVLRRAAGRDVGRRPH
jgi:plastocyanin